MYDIIIKNGLVIDGTGRDAYPADIAIKGDRIAQIGGLSSSQAGEIMDAAGKYVTPGFIEPHSHADISLLFEPSLEAYLMQGVTTVVGGNCGHSMAPMGDAVYRTAITSDLPVQRQANPLLFDPIALYMEKAPAAKALKERFNIDLDWHSFGEYNRKCDALPLDGNVAPLIGHSAVRNAVMGMDCLREATEAEIIEMECLVRDAMAAGAFGLSTGRDPSYVPGPFATDWEIIRLLKIVGEYDGIFTSHTKNFKDGILNRMPGYQEMFLQAKAAGVRAHVAHVHLMGAEDTEETAVAEARRVIDYYETCNRSGLDISYDIIPLTSDFHAVGFLAQVFSPLVVMLGSRQRLSELLKYPDFREYVREMVKSGRLGALDPDAQRNFYQRGYILAHKDTRYEGRKLLDCAQELGRSPLELTLDLMAQDSDARCGSRFQNWNRAYDILINHPLAMPCADNGSGGKDTDPGTLTPALPQEVMPIMYQYIPTFIRRRPGRLEDTVHQMSGYPARRFGIQERGTLTVGHFADIVVLNMDKLNAFELKSAEYPDGFEHVIVNGVPTIENRRHLGASAGRILRKG